MPVSIDFETRLVSQAEPVPPPVVLSIHWGDEDNNQDLIHAKDPACRRVLRALWEDETVVLSAFNASFESQVSARHFGLLDQVWAAYDAKRVHCTMVRQKLIDIARGEYRGYFDPRTHKWIKHEYKLEAVAPRWGCEQRSKADSWRLRYGELMDVPIAHWDEEAKQYPLDDTFDDQVIFLGQEEHIELLEDQYRQFDKAFCLSCISRNGIATSVFMVSKYKELVQAKLDSARDLLIEKGYLSLKTKGRDAGKYKKEQKKIQEYARQWCESKGIDMPETETGLPSFAAENAGKYKNKVITAYCTWSSASTQMDRVRELEMGCNGLRIHTHFDELIKSGRTSSAAPNIQNRDTKPGDRDCIIADEGWVGGDADFDGLELRTIAQSCIDTVGFSRLAEFLNAGEDPHLEVAAKLLGITYEQAKSRYKDDDPDVIDARGAGKAKMVNFSSWAGTTVKGLYHHQLEAGIKTATMESSGELYQAFLDSWPEAKEYFKWVRSKGPDMFYSMVPRSNRYVGGLSYTECCSIHSQGLGADATQEALRALCRHSEYYTKSILFGCPVLNYIHDQFHMQFPDDELAHDRAMKMGEVMREAANVYLPDVPTRAKPLLTYRFTKMAKAVYDKANRLIPWDYDLLGETDSQGRPWPKDLALVRQWAIQENRRGMRRAA